jgi:hypothetical protein
MRDSKVLHNSSVNVESVGAKPLNTNEIELETHMVVDVCDNRWATARKLLILKRRDAGAVDQARLESSALEACRDVPKHLFRSPFNHLALRTYRSVFSRK